MLQAVLAKGWTPVYTLTLGRWIALNDIDENHLTTSVFGNGFAAGSGNGTAAAVGAGTAITVNANDVAIDTTSTITFVDDPATAWSFPVGTTGQGLFITGTPVDGTHAINKTYADNLVNGARWKGNADLATSVADGDITLSGEQTIDGTLTSTSRVLVKSQSAGAENGLYDTAAGAWTRTTDMDSGNEADSAAVYVEGGTENGGSAWTQTVDSVTIDSTAQTYVQFNGAGSISAGNGLTKSGNTINFADGSTGDHNGLNIAAGDVSVAVGAGIQITANQVAFTPGDVITGGSAEIDGDQLDIDFTPTNYTPSTAPAEASDLDHLTAHLAGIDNAIAGVSTETKNVEYFELAAGDITAGKVDLANTPTAASSVQVWAFGGPQQVNAALDTAAQTPDFEMNVAELIIRDDGTATPAESLTNVFVATDIIGVSYPS
jgi:hypothetical protein